MILDVAALGLMNRVETTEVYWQSLADVDAGVVLTVKDGVAVSHRFYYDQLDFMGQLGLTETGAAAGSVPQPRTGAEQAAEQTTAG